MKIVGRAARISLDSDLKNSHEQNHMAWMQKIKGLFSFVDSVPRVVLAEGVYNLQAMYDELNAQYFEGRVCLSIDWFGRNPSSGRSHRKVLGYYNSGKKCIRIHTSLNHPFFPPYFVAYVIYHEMVHSIAPPMPGRTRRKVHHEEFRKRERGFHDYAIAKQWEQENLAKILYGREIYGRT
ncbi:MAG: hypothetical protein NTZ52_00780 [Chlamydiae bacterium]|nr:hypothetical protein [Chlamydiota bacterium]